MANVQLQSKNSNTLTPSKKSK